MSLEKYVASTSGPLVEVIYDHGCDFSSFVVESHETPTSKTNNHGCIEAKVIDSVDFSWNYKRSKLFQGFRIP